MNETTTNMTSNGHAVAAAAAAAAAAQSEGIPPWNTLPPMAEYRVDAGGVCVNDHQFLVIGGQDDESLMSSEYYDTRTKKWTNFPADLPQGRRGMGVVMAGDRVFVIGGMICSPARGSQKNIMRFVKQVLQNNEESHRETTSNVISIDFSSVDGGHDLSLYQPGRRDRTWKDMAPMGQERTFFACVTDGKYIYVCGGEDKDEDALQTAERYDIEQNVWTPLPDMPDARRWVTAGMVGNKIYVVGGMDQAQNKLGSTVVFDTSTQQWEFLNRDQKLAQRIGFSTVVVDRFVVLIGVGSRDKSTEYLDTAAERNGWQYAPSPLRFGRRGTAVGYLKATNEIIVCGGIGVHTMEHFNAAEIINVHHGIFRGTGEESSVEDPTSEGGSNIADLADVTEKIGNKGWKGKDELLLGTIAGALFETLAFKNLKAPFLLGVLGKCGRGKTSFFNMIVDNIKNAQKREATEMIDEVFVDHIFFVQLHNGGSSNGDIWSSLTNQIAEDVTEQMQVKGRAKTTVIGFFHQVIKYLRENAKQILETIDSENTGINGNNSPKRLLEAIMSDLIGARKELATSERQIIDIQKRTSEAMEAMETIEKMKPVFNFLGDRAMDEILKIIQNEMLTNGVSQVQKYRGKWWYRSCDDSTDSILSRLNLVNWRLWIFGLRLSNIPPCSMAFSGLLVIIAIALHFLIGMIVAMLVPLVLSVLILIATSISCAMKHIHPLIIELEALFDKNKTSEVLDVKGNKYTDEITELMKQKIERKAEIERRYFELEGICLRKKIEEEIYRGKGKSNIGIAQQLQQDLKFLTESMLDERQQSVFPRGHPRVVLIVDDLDHCTDETVQALQVLAYTGLFVVVLAVDPRFVKGCLEQCQNGKLSPNTSLSGLDFLEKMIQIPFRLPEIRDDTDEDEDVAPEQSSDDQIHHYTESLLCLWNNFAATAASDSVPIQSWGDSADDFGSADSGGDGDQGSDGGTLPMVAFTRNEGEIVAKLFRLFRVRPPYKRRIENVFKVLHVIWKRNGKWKPNSTSEEDLRWKRDTFFLILLASEQSTRNATFEIFACMESTMRTYPTVDGGDATNGKSQTNDIENNLAKLFAKEMKNSNEGMESFHNGGEGEKGTLMDHIEEYLSDYKWTDKTEWDKISQTFFLARSFSFFRLGNDADDYLVGEDLKRVKEAFDLPVDPLQRRTRYSIHATKN